MGKTPKGQSAEHGKGGVEKYINELPRSKLRGINPDEIETLRKR